MKTTTARWLAWPIGGLSIALTLGGVAFMLADRHVSFPPEYTGWTGTRVFDVTVNIGTAVIGIVLASRRPSNPIGWLALVAGSAIAMATFAEPYAAHALLAHPGSLPGGDLMFWLSSWAWPIAVGGLPFLFLLFPTGHLPSGRWLPFAWFTGGTVALLTLLVAAYDARWFADPFRPASPVTGPFAVLGAVFMVVLPATFVGSLGSLVLRYRASFGEERLQLKWFVTASALVAVTSIG